MLLKNVLCQFFIFYLGSSYENRRGYQINPKYANSQKDIITTLEKNNVLQHFYLYHFKPVGGLEISFNPNGTTDCFSVDMGNYVSPLDSLDIPEISFQAFFPLDEWFMKDLYTIVITEWYADEESCRAIWTNIKLDENNIDEFGKMDDYDLKLPGSSRKHEMPFKVHFKLRKKWALVPYEGPRPRAKTGMYKYIFILFRQPYGKIPFEKLKFRNHWGSEVNANGVEEWADYYNLQPLAVNFFQSANEGDFK